MTKDMTNGNSMKLILGFCLPLICGNLFQQLYNMVDSIIVGKFVGVDSLAAIGSTGSLNFLIIGFATGICSGFAIMVAQAFGAKDYVKMRKYVINAIYLAIITSIIMTIVMYYKTYDLLVWMKTPNDIINEAYNYIFVIFMGISATIAYNLLSAILRSLGDAKTPLLFLIIASFLNVVLDLVFIINFGMKAAGAAWATVISQAISAILCYIYIKRKVHILHFQKNEKAINLKYGYDLIKVGLPMALQFSITAVGTIVVQVAVNTLGSAIVASVSAASKITLMLFQPMESLGLTMATYCGQNLGACNLSRIKEGLRKSYLLSFIYTLIAMFVTMVLGNYLIQLFIDSKEIEIINLAQQYMNTSAIFYYVLGILFILRNALQGMGYSVASMLAGIFELVARCLVAFLLVDKLGYQAICLANPAAWIAADILLVSLYLLVQKDLKNRCNVKFM